MSGEDRSNIDEGAVMRRLSRGALLSPKTVLFPTSPARRLSGQAGATEGHSISIEGNIGVGKSTFLRLMNKVKGLEGNIVTMPEPVSKWQDVAGKGNLLQKFYEEPNRYAYTFQSYAFITRFVQHNEGVQSNPGKKKETKKKRNRKRGGERDFCFLDLISKAIVKKQQHRFQPSTDFFIHLRSFSYLLPLLLFPPLQRN